MKTVFKYIIALLAVFTISAAAMGSYYGWPKVFDFAELKIKGHRVQPVWSAYIKLTLVPFGNCSSDSRFPAGWGCSFDDTTSTATLTHNFNLPDPRKMQCVAITHQVSGGAGMIGSAQCFADYCYLHFKDVNGANINPATFAAICTLQP